MILQMVWHQLQSPAENLKRLSWQMEDGPLSSPIIDLCLFGKPLFEAAPSVP